MKLMLNLFSVLVLSNSILNFKMLKITQIGYAQIDVFLVLSSWMLFVSLNLTRRPFKMSIFWKTTLVGKGITANN